jgi:hypothetical protein
MDEVMGEKMKMQATGGFKEISEEGGARKKKKRNSQSLKTTAVFKAPGRDETYAYKVI